MKKRFWLFIGFAMLIFQVMPAYALAENKELKEENAVCEQKIASGFTVENIYYEVFSESTIDTPQIESAGKYVKRTVKYFSTTIVVPQNLYWEETIDGTLYSGNLDLASFSRDYKLSVTFAYFEGYLYAE